MRSTLPQSNRPKTGRALASLLTSLFLIGLSIFVWTNRQYLVDLVTYWRYEPTSAIAALTERTQLTDQGKFAFYASEPSLDGNRTFNARCDRKEAETAILGCYSANRIYIYDVTDKRLDGIKEVTAAHELLHAVYQRLSEGERQTVNRLVEAEFEKLKDDPHFTERMAFYARTEPGQRDNELHSIIGTEVESISSELEEHYKQYFRNRSAIVALHTGYRSVFTELTDKAEKLSAELESLSEKVKTASSRYNTNVRELNSDIEAFNNDVSSDRFTSQAQFTTERNALLSRVNAVNAERTTIDSLVKQYELLREEYNTIVTTSNELYQSIDSSLAPAPKV